MVELLAIAGLALSIGILALALAIFGPFRWPLRVTFSVIGIFGCGLCFLIIDGILYLV